MRESALKHIFMSWRSDILEMINENIGFILD